MKFKTPWNSHEFPSNYEKVSSVSMTIPDQSMTVKEIMDRYARGLPVNGERSPVYHGEEFVPDLERMDLSEIEDLKSQVTADIKELQSRLGGVRPTAYVQSTIPLDNNDQANGDKIAQ